MTSSTAHAARWNRAERDSLPQAARRAAPEGAGKTGFKEQQLGLFADRTSCSAWWANQLRLLFPRPPPCSWKRSGGWAERHRVGARAGQHDPPEALENRHGDPAQYAPHSAALFQRLPVAVALRDRAHAPQHGLKWFRCCPGSAKTTAGKGQCLHRSRKLANSAADRLPTTQNSRSAATHPLTLHTMKDAG